MSEGVVTGLGLVFASTAGALAGMAASFPLNALACAVSDHGNALTAAASLAAMTWAIFGPSRPFLACAKACGLGEDKSPTACAALKDVEYFGLRPGLFMLGAGLLTAPACKLGVQVLAGLLGVLSAWSKT